MIRLAQLMRQYQQAFTTQYASKMTYRHYQAMTAMMACHTSAQGELHYQCGTCEHKQTLYRSCGHRSCPACQHQTNNQWLERQRQKLLPTDYYMITFTLPRELRSFVWHHQEWAFKTLFAITAGIINTFYKNDKCLGVEPGFTGILHTHSRRKDFHPHMHYIVPNGGVNKEQRVFKQKNKRYLFNGRALAARFRRQFLKAMKDAGFYAPANIPNKWIAQCKKVGRGEPALVYMARYLYRGVISENDIIDHSNGKVTFRYRDSRTKKMKTRTESAVTFLWLILQHVLPKGFRRVRDYGFLHGNAKKTRHRIQLMLRACLSHGVVPAKKMLSCTCCGSHMLFVGMTTKRYANNASTRPRP